MPNPIWRLDKSLLLNNNYFAVGPSVGPLRLFKNASWAHLMASIGPCWSIRSHLPRYWLRKKILEFRWCWLKLLLGNWSLLNAGWSHQMLARASAAWSSSIDWLKRLTHWSDTLDKQNRQERCYNNSSWIPSLMWPLPTKSSNHLPRKTFGCLMLTKDGMNYSRLIRRS